MFPVVFHLNFHYSSYGGKLVKIFRERLFRRHDTRTVTTSLYCKNDVCGIPFHKYDSHQNPPHLLLIKVFNSNVNHVRKCVETTINGFVPYRKVHIRTFVVYLENWKFLFMSCKSILSTPRHLLIHDSWLTLETTIIDRQVYFFFWVE